MTSDSFCLNFPFKDKLFVNVSIEDGVITGVEFSSSPCQSKVESKEAGKLMEDLSNYFEGYKTDFKGHSVELDTTDFVERVLDEVRNIPYGETVTYGELASRLETAPRAIGQAMKRNPIPLVIPCHRVVSAKGLGGFSSGVDIKKELLRLESSIEQE
ncbi:MAG: methylated-DNA--[protein]-cysteine S-methyltransferase [Archaeoglobaceae archaeon]